MRNSAGIFRTLPLPAPKKKKKRRKEKFDLQSVFF